MNKHQYDGVELGPEELIVQTRVGAGSSKGKPAAGAAAAAGAGGARTIPLELFYKTDAEPTYSITSDDDNRALDTQLLPFQAYGALGMARDNDDTDSASADFFFLKWRQALIPPGRNTLDGYLSCFGYVVSENGDWVLKQVRPGDTVIERAKVVSGGELLR